MPDLSFLAGWIQYPISETAHFLQGVLTGWLGTRAIFKKEVSDAIVAFLIFSAFSVYEITEQWKVNDSAYQDFENFWVAAMITGIFYTILYFFDRWRKNRG